MQSSRLRGSSETACPDIDDPLTFHLPRITRLVVEGNTLLNVAAVSSALAGFSGEHRSFDDIEHAVEALQKLYRARSFNLVKVTLSGDHRLT